MYLTLRHFPRTDHCGLLKFTHSSYNKLQICPTFFKFLMSTSSVSASVGDSAHFLSNKTKQLSPQSVENM